MTHLWRMLRCARSLLVPLVALLYAAGILWLQPADHFGISDKVPQLGRLFYDDYDMVAFALRGLNAHLGRTGGLADYSGHYDAADFDAALDEGNHTLKAGYFLEYPHSCLLLFRLGYVWQVGFQKPPAVVCDASYHDLVEHVPRNDGERQVVRQFRGAMRTYVLLMAMCLLALMAVLRFGYRPGAAAPVWPLLLPATLYFALNRFDVVPALLTALSLACLGRRRVAAAAALLAAAIAFKLYPVVLVPLLLAYVGRERRTLAIWVLAFTITLALFLVPTVLLSGWDAFWAPYRFQLTRMHFPPTIYGYLLPESWADSAPGPTAFRLFTLMAVIGALSMRRMGSLESLLRRSGIVLIVFVSLAVFYSPQWILWFVPLLLPLVASQRWLIVPIVALDLVTYVTFPGMTMDYFQSDPWQPYWLAVLVYIRFALLGLMLAMLGWAEFRPAAAMSTRGLPAAPQCPA